MQRDGATVSVMPGTLLRRTSLGQPEIQVRVRVRARVRARVEARVMARVLIDIIGALCSSSQTEKNEHCIGSPGRQRIVRPHVAQTRVPFVAQARVAGGGGTHPTTATLPLYSEQALSCGHSGALGMAAP